MIAGVLDPTMIEPPDVDALGDTTMAEIHAAESLPEGRLFDLDRVQIAIGHYRSMGLDDIANIGLLEPEGDAQPVLGIWPDDGTTAVVVCPRWRQSVLEGGA